MGRSYLVRKTVRFTVERGIMTAHAWDGKGRATDKRLAEYVKGIEESFEPGGVNERAGATVGRILTAEIVDQFDGGRVVARYEAPANPPREQAMLDSHREAVARTFARRAGR
jgi:hypothetical protein